MRDSPFLLRLEPDVKKQLKVLAATLDISMTELINRLVLKYLDMEKEHGKEQGQKSLNTDYWACRPA